MLHLVETIFPKWFRMRIARTDGGRSNYVMLVSYYLFSIKFLNTSFLLSVNTYFRDFFAKSPLHSIGTCQCLKVST